MPEKKSSIIFRVPCKCWSGGGGGGGGGDYFSVSVFDSLPPENLGEKGSDSVLKQISSFLSPN